MQRLLFFLVCLYVLAACTPPSRPPRPAAVDPEQVRGRLAALPGAELKPEIGVSYPGDSLFAEGAALPLPGGGVVLDPLAAVMKEFSGLAWRGTVRAQTAFGAEYDQALAKKRAELLARYFHQRGVPPERLLLLPEGGAGSPFELSAEAVQSSIPANSLREKR